MIETPTFEFFEIFNTEIGTISDRSMYKFIDRDGSTLVLRPDITPSIARVVTKNFPYEGIPLRFAYCGKVFVNNFALQGKLKETTQIGAELIGDRDMDGDAEIIALAINLLLVKPLSELMKGRFFLAYLIVQVIMYALNFVLQGKFVYNRKN